MADNCSIEIKDISVAVLLPCYNEEAAIAKTIAGFQAVFPDASIYVYDNNSIDNTKAVAAAAGAIVRSEKIQGKGAVVRRMFADVEADVYVLADGDATYDHRAAPAMVSMLVGEQLDMVVGTRVHDDPEAYRRGHQFGNKMLTSLLTFMFGRSFTDILSGYRIFSRRFVKSFPVLSVGFEIETEISIHALQLEMPVSELKTAYFARPEGSVSKLSTYRDGFRILSTMIRLYRFDRPIPFFGAIAAAFGLVGGVLSIPIISTYLETGLVPRLPTAVLVVTLMILGALAVASGLVLDTVARGRLEVKRLVYLRYGNFGVRERKKTGE